MVIQPSDSVADVLARDGRLLDVLIAASPVFEKLRNPLMRKTMGRLATLEQAARVARIDAEDLVDRLNRALDGPAGAATQATAAPVPDEPAPADPRPAWLASLPEDAVLELDVREELRSGGEPFSRIMAALREVPADGALLLRAVFEPVPLYAVLGKRGYAHWTERLAEDDWCVWFRAGAAEPATQAAPRPAADAVPAEEGTVVLDVRGMEPPEPMVRTLAALESLPAGETLVQVNERVPQFLLPRLAELGFEYEVREPANGPVRTFIRRRAKS